MRRRTYLRSAGVAGVVALTGCTGGGGGQNQSGATTTTTAADGGGGGGSPTVTMVDTTFDPLHLSVAPGTTVTWTNEDGFAHTVVSATLTDAGDEWSYQSGTVAAGGSVEHAFPDPGVFEYYCSIHGKGTMCGVVLVGDQQYDATLPCASEGGGGGGGGGYY
ncbi:MAG: plastocyanin/azurin family copper-binding protein [Halanaeroarchaeum sp.]